MPAIEKRIFSGGACPSVGWLITAVITRPKSGVVPRSYEKRRQSAPLIEANMPDHHGRSKDPQHGRHMRQKNTANGAGDAPKRETAAAVLRRLACCRDTAASCAAAVRSPPVGRRVVVSWSHGVSAFVQRMRGDRGCVCVWLRSHDRAA